MFGVGTCAIDQKLLHSTCVILDPDVCLRYENCFEYHGVDVHVHTIVGNISRDNRVVVYPKKYYWRTSVTNTPESS
jgi:hypothetical protein